MKGRRFLLVTGLFLLVAAVGAMGAAGAPKVPDPGQAGPYAVGHASMMLYDSSRPCDLGDRPIPVEVFYPVDTDSLLGGALPAVYPLDPINHFWPETSSLDWEPYGLDPAFEEPAPSPDKPFPLVVFSPGWGTPIWFHLYQGARLASHGFVVAILYHYGDAWFPWEQFDHIATACVNRPLDVSYVLTYLLAANASTGQLLSGLIDPGRIAASGWSLGGYASMVLAGGIDNVGDYFDQSPWTDMFGPPPVESMVALQPDPRIKAILPLDGSNQVLEFHELTRVRVPAIGIGEEWSTLYVVQGPGMESWQARQHAAFLGHPSYRVDVAGAYHQSFCNGCEAVHLLYEKGLFDEPALEFWEGMVCAAPTPNSVVLPLSTRYMIAFLKTNLCGEQGYKNILTPGYVLANEPYLEFFVAEPRHPNAIDDWPAWPAVPDAYYCFPHQPGSGQFKAEKNPAQSLLIPHMGMRRQK